MDYIVVRSVDRAGVVLGLIFVALGWVFVGFASDEPVNQMDQISVAAICGLVGFGVSRTIGYSFPFPDKNKDRAVSRISAFYQGAWFACIMCAILAFDSDVLRIAVMSVVTGGMFGGINYFAQARRRAALSRDGFGFDFSEPVDFSTRQGRNLVRYPFILVFMVGYMTYFSGDPNRILAIWALFLGLIPQLYPTTHSRVWTWIGYFWVAGCFGTVAYVEYAY